MRADQALSLADLEHMARRHLPRLLFETIESGVEDETGLATNRDAFRRQRFLPHACTDVSERVLATTLFGERYAAPFGVAPTGIAGVFRRGAELMLAEAAREARVPLILSGASMIAPERVAAVSPASTWFQLYPARDSAISADMVDRVEAAGVPVLVLTVDNPVSPNRERDKRNGFHLPFRRRPSMALDALRHPAWLLRFLREGGVPDMETWQPYTPPGTSPAEFFRSQSPIVQTWRDLELLRRRWPRRLVLKGILRPDDAAAAAAMGVDGIIVSNHGGKALDRVPAPLDMLPEVRRAVPPEVPVMIDSGVRRGSDVATALCLGADFVFLGRPTLYAVAAAGTAGVRRALRILRDELDTTLGLIGCADVAELGPDYLYSGEDTAHLSNSRAAVLSFSR